LSNGLMPVLDEEGMMTAVPSLRSISGTGAVAGRAKRPWRPMALTYVNDVGNVMKATHKSGQKGETDIFTNKRVS
jgi:hypothetical protein